MLVNKTDVRNFYANSAIDVQDTKGLGALSLNATKDQNNHISFGMQIMDGEVYKTHKAECDADEKEFRDWVYKEVNGS